MLWGGFFSLGTTGMLRPRGSWLWGSVRCTVGCSAAPPGLHPLDTSSAYSSPVVRVRKSQWLQTLPSVPGGQVYGLRASALNFLQNPPEEGGTTCAKQPPGCADRLSRRAVLSPAREDNGECRRGFQSVTATKSKGHLCNLPLNTFSKILKPFQLFKYDALYKENSERASGCIPRD